MRRIASFLAAALLAVPLPAQEAKAPSPYDRAIAAGYKALTLCSAMFVAGRTQAQAEALELTGTYPEYQPLLPTLPARINRKELDVKVPFDVALPPRQAFWSKHDGCTLLPIGAEPVLIDEEPMAADGSLTPRRPGPKPADPRAWPLGDGDILPRPDPALANKVAAAFDTAGPRTVGMVIVADGRIVAERYAEGFGPFIANRTWSVAKSLTGTLVGAAVQRGLSQTAAPANVPEWAGANDPRRAITLDNLLHMSSGLHSATAGNRTDAVYFGGTAVTEETVAWPLAVKPGTRFRYANNDILLAMRSLRASMGDQRYATFPDDALFQPLGMRHTVAERDWKGNFILSSQVWSTARDLARFGMLYLDDGVRDGKRVLPEGWVKYVTTPSGPQPEGEFGYGATFWLLNKSPGVPADTFAAFGNRGQYVVIVPSRKVVIVRRGEDPTGARFDVAKFTADVLAALK